MKKILLLIVMISASLAGGSPAVAGIQTKSIDYRDGPTELQGYLVWDDSLKGKRPGVLVVHEWWGLNDYARQRARQLAKAGYVAFALDMYGKGRVTKHPDQASTWMKQVQENRDAWVRRATAGLAAFKKQPLVDTDRLAAIGYCFGGATVLNMAYAGVDLKAVVSFHGALPLPDEKQQEPVLASILVAQGYDDPFVPPEQVSALQAALAKLDADWEVIVFGATRHSFTNPDAASYGMEALAYNAKADHRSWAMMLELFNEKFNQ